jgi:hypothetical protein
MSAPLYSINWNCTEHLRNLVEDVLSSHMAFLLPRYAQFTIKKGAADPFLMQEDCPTAPFTRGGTVLSVNIIPIACFSLLVW